MASFEIFHRTRTSDPPEPLELYDLMLGIDLAYNYDADKVRAFGRLVGCNNPIFYDHPDPLVPDAIFWPVQEGLVITISGSTSLAHWWNHLMHCVQVPGGEFGGRIHSFWKWAADQATLHALDKVSWGGSGRRLVIAGHSYGGALALLVAIRLQGVLQNYGIDLVTFGQPRTGRWSEGLPFAGSYWRISNRGDPIVSLPPLGIGRLALGGVFAHGLDVDFYQHYGRAFQMVRNQPLGYRDPLHPGGTCNLFPSLSPELDYLQYIAAEQNFGAAFSAKLIGIILGLFRRGSLDAFNRHPISEYLISAQMAVESTPNPPPVRYWDLRRFASGGDWILPPDRPPAINNPGGDPDKWRDFGAGSLAPFIPAPDDDTSNGWDGENSTQPLQLPSEERFRLDYFFSLLGGPTEMRRFRGHDRAILDTTLKGLNAIFSRDRLVPLAALTTRISTRTYVIPYANEELTSAFVMVKERLEAALAENET